MREAVENLVQAIANGDALETEKAFATAMANKKLSLKKLKQMMKKMKTVKKIKKTKKKMVKISKR